ncbi:FKBP-type peptidyl-prolyl cis-trans isomerase [Luteimonas viscosa]|uniref:Peptidyl-prolyl cis-trans isomerase n=1 Tax=Luteimonas viscosa TaxID=1132694 RepID=A0A5D4XLF9_9GAMM|nr:FKBP-type peptidyl-prolyl cis-trans isomerase [Luteimonas viscosa]TYT23712.1 FKBP-type peptidyl-prolyl cis-trans isomerase [Luteimonas viscosa]
MRSTSLVVLGVALSVALLACKPLDKETGKPVDGSGEDAPAVAAKGGLKTEKEQVSYVIGMQIGDSLKAAKDEVDLDTVFKAVRSTIDGKEPVLTQEEAMQVMQDFSMRMQARQMAEIQESGKKNAAEGEKFLAENAGKPDVQTTASGLQYQVLSEGSGTKPKAGDTVRVHYKGTLLDGETFDDSYARGEPVEFALAQVVPGWQEGLQLMPVGSKYKLWIPGKLGYGEQGTPGGPIGPNATLVFEVELLDIVNAAE